MAAGSGMQSDVDRGLVRIGENCPLVHGEIGVRIPQYYGADASALQFLAQAPRQRQRDVLFEQAAAEALTVIIAAMTGVHDSENNAEPRPAEQ